MKISINQLKRLIKEVVQDEECPDCGYNHDLEPEAARHAHEYGDLYVQKRTSSDKKQVKESFMAEPEALVEALQDAAKIADSLQRSDNDRYAQVSDNVMLALELMGVSTIDA